jgi:hypothetical protein
MYEKDPLFGDEFMKFDFFLAVNVIFAFLCKYQMKATGL